jgi:two-component system, sensor histidine kinase
MLQFEQSATATARDNRERRFISWLLRFGPYASILFGVSAVVLIWAGTIYFARSERQQTERSALQNADNLSRAFEEYIVRLIQASDQTMRYVAEAYAKDPRHFDIWRWAHNGALLGSFDFQIFIVAKNGEIIAGDPRAATSDAVLSNRQIDDYAAQKTDQLVIAKPAFVAAGQKWSIPLLRRITMPDGSFGGSVIAMLDPGSISQFYRPIDVGEKGIVSLTAEDGTVLARGSKGPLLIGQTVAGGSLLKEFARKKAGHYTAESPLDGIDRLVVYRQVSGYPLIIAVGLAVDEVFELHRQNSYRHMIMATLLMLSLLGVTVLMVFYEQLLADAREAAEAGIRARSEFLAMMSHEIRTPMNGVIGTAELLLESGVSGEQAGYATTIRESAAHLMKIINDVLDFSKLDADRIEIEHIRFNLHDLVERTVALLAAQAQEKRLTLTVDVRPEVLRAVIGDPGRLRQVLLNFVGNALKFTQFGGVAVTVAAGRNCPPGKARLVFSIADTGIGIPADGIPLLFREFSQLDSSIARRFGGTGLGLAICKRLIDLMDGTIAVESEVGNGTTFTFTIDFEPAPSEPAEAEDSVALPATRRAEAAGGGPLRVLVVEDDKTNQMVANKLLEGLGHAVDVAGNGAEAITACAAFEYDVVFMDIMMPGMDGFEATRAIRKLKPPFGSPRIIALTADTQQQSRQACFAAGLDGILTKPVTRATLAATLSSVRPAHESISIVPMPGDDRPSASSFDDGVYAELAAALGPADIKSVIEQFLSDSHDRLRELRGAIGSADRNAIRHEAHAGKSSAANLGFLRLSQLMEDLEHNADTLDPSALRLRLEVLEAEFAVVQGIASAKIAAAAAATAGAGVA